MSQMGKTSDSRCEGRFVGRPKPARLDDQRVLRVGKRQTAGRGSSKGLIHVAFVEGLRVFIMIVS